MLGTLLALLAAAQDPGACPSTTASRTDSSAWNGWGVDLQNTRFQPVELDLPRLKLKWAFGFRGANAAIAQPAIVGGRAYFGSVDGTVYALDARTGCVYWTFKADGQVRAAITVAAIQAGRFAVLFADMKAQLYAVDAHSAKLVWKTRLDEHPMARLTGAPKLWEARLYVPLSSHEEVPSASPKYPCCTFRGAVVAVDVESGKVLWKTHTISEEPKPTRKTSLGTQLYGPSGAAVWSSPTIDLKTRTVFAATGNGYSEPSAPTTDSVLAFDMDSGKLKWHAQLTPDDNFIMGCAGSVKETCPEKPGPDFDIGASPILRGRTLIVGQKSGVVYALDADRQGKILWQTRVGKGSALGGVHWGMAADEQAAYVPVSDVLTPTPGGLFALNLTDGKTLWHAPAIEPACKGTRGCTPAQAAPATAIRGAVFSGAMDGVLRAYSAADGKVIWEFDTRRDFETVNGVPAKGGSLNATGPVVAEKMLFVNSGYGILGGMPGNVLLAFSIDGK